ncbi:hypothetical protein Tdes44962_MAKER06989 [Teratosphaeria destructans]|uniref:Uncharacterized protein n=1 Tax=Teratosphaeria destructans TaxID=418781 RepID=A0A9W7T0T4_9PEZI|nr:hypothetical protein Tdes44962_MAKER06989 [Teratosphaeria destructans]
MYSILAIATTLLFFTKTTLAGDRKFYDNCRCASLNVGGQAAGVSLPEATKKACDAWRSRANGWQTGTWDVVDGWCKVTSGDSANRFAGDTWWTICVDQAGADSGQCAPYEGLS